MNDGFIFVALVDAVQDQYNTVHLSLTTIKLGAVRKLSSAWGLLRFLLCYLDRCDFGSGVSSTHVYLHLSL